MRSTRTRLVRAILPGVLALALAACGTIPSAPSGGGTVPGPATSTTSVAAPSPAAGSASPTQTQTQTQIQESPKPRAKPKPKPGKTKPGKTKPGAATDTWVGHFKGREIRVPRGNGANVSFTFDDGPWPDSTSQVLKLLKQHHVQATFCLIGNQAKAHPSLVRREVAAGHELCAHSRDHDLAMGKKGARYVDAEVGDGLVEIKKAAPRGTPVRFYRQPGGLWSPTVVKAMNKHDLDPLRWSDDPRDWSRPGSTVIVRRVVSQLHPGAVILMHDGGGDRSQSVEALRFLLHALIAAGWKPVLAPYVKMSDKAAARPQ